MLLFPNQRDFTFREKLLQEFRASIHQQRRKNAGKRKKREVRMHFAPSKALVDLQNLLQREVERVGNGLSG